MFSIFMLAKITNKKTVEWHSTDQETLFEKNLKNSNDDWVYRKKKIYYNFNSDGYRCPEWQDINWLDSIVLIGCSYTLGVGLADEDTVSSQLQKITGHPTVNLGVGSSSNHLMLFNSLRLIDQRIHPKAVIVLYSDVSRFTHISKDYAIRHYGNWIYPTHAHHLPESKLTMPTYSKHDLDFYTQWLQDYNSDVYGEMAARSVENAWKSAGVKFVGCSAYNGQMSNRYLNLSKQVDKARDLQHPGIESVRNWAHIIANAL